MREIKFRAWEKNNNHWFTGWNDPECADITMDDSIIWEIKNPSEDLIIEQFTGLLDKNGKEIYEGDIVRLCRAMKYSGNRGDIGSVDFDPSELGYLIMNVYARSRLTESRAKYMEVIGNIHENPELLK